jgi:hypothetical protein
MPQTKEWFLSNIGKRIFRNKLKYCCPICDGIYKNGLIIHYKMHARYLYDTQNEFGAEGIEINYKNNK